MHKTTVRNPIHLVRDGGEIVQTFTGWDQLLHCWPFIRRYDIGPGPSHKKEWFLHHLTMMERIRVDCGTMPYPRHEYLLRDSIGNIIPPQDVQDAWNKKNPYRSRYWWYPGANRHYRSYFRSPRTTQERRWANAWDDEEYAPKKGFARARRNYHNLPNAWDDIPHKDWSYRNWKHYRKHQWKD